MSFQGIVGNADQKADDQAAPSTADAGTGESASQKDDRTVPYHRFQQVNARVKEWEQKYEALEKQIAEIKSAANPNSPDYDPNMDFEKAMKKVEERAANMALERLRSEQEAKTNAQRKYEALIEDGFDHLRDEGHKISKKEEEAISEIALEYGIRIEKPEDMAKAFKIFDLQRKTAGAGKSKDAETPASAPKPAGGAGK